MNKMQCELNHLFSGSCNRVVTDIPQNLTLTALLRNLLGLGDINQSIKIFTIILLTHNIKRSNIENTAVIFNELFIRHLKLL